MRFWKRLPSVICVALLAGCAPAPGRMVVGHASIYGSVLSVHLRWHPAAAVLDALDHGIALNFVVDVRAQAPNAFGIYRTVARQRRRLQLRYFPLSRRYQLRDLDREQTRSYAARAAALAALDDLRLRLGAWNAAHSSRFQVALELDRDALPGALRLPALLQPDWHISSDTYTWPAARS